MNGRSFSVFSVILVLSAAVATAGTVQEPGTPAWFIAKPTWQDTLLMLA